MPHRSNVQRQKRRPSVYGARGITLAILVCSWLAVGGALPSTLRAASPGDPQASNPASRPTPPKGPGSGTNVANHAAPAQPQFHFTLRNGDRLTGIVVSEDTNSIVITNSLIGRVEIPARQVERREAVAPTALAVTPPLRPVATNATNAVAAAALPPERKKQLENLTQNYLANEISGVEFQRRRSEILRPPPRPPKRWSGEILAGVDVGYGAKSRQNFSGRLKVNYVEQRLRNAFDYLFTYGHTEGVLSANRMDATDKVDFTLHPKYYLYTLGGAGHDEVRKIDYYIQVGPGLGRRLIERTNLALNVEAGVNYQLQNFEGGRDAYLFYHRLAQDFKWTITPKFTIDEKIEYMPQWDDFGEFKVRVEGNLRYWLLDNLSLNLTVIDLYDTRVARGISRNDLQIRSSIGVKF
jgi:putative salt-induced outer membrane protein YdiY